MIPIAIRVHRSAPLVLAGLLLGLAPGLVHAQCDASQVCIPQPTCAYVSTSTVVYGATPFEVRFLQLSSPSACQPPAPPGGTVNSFFDVFVDLQISGNGGGTWQPGHGVAHGTIRTVTEPGGTTFDTEMLQLDLSGGTLPPGVMLRESPTLASTGQEHETPQGGTFHIDSFFDVFTELSVDGGNSWIPGNGSSHETVTPSSPTPTHPATWGSLKDLYR